MTILEALDDPRLFGGAIRDRATWAPWRSFLAALFGLLMPEAEADIYHVCTGRAELPAGPFTAAWLICGRRAGKSFVLALVACFLACFRDYRPYLNVGERAVIMVVAADREQAKIVIRYVKGLLAVPALARLIEGETADSVDLANQVTVEVVSAHYRSVRGRTVAAALVDEIAFLPQDDSATPDTEIIAALTPAMATIPGALMLCSSSPHARRGVLWEAFKRYHGTANVRVLVWKAPTRAMNSTVPQEFIDEEMEKDPAKATAEYLAEFRTDVETFVRREVVDAAVVPGRYELFPVSGVNYFGFVDPSGGSQDSMTLAIGHREKDGRGLLDAVRERRPPFSPEHVTSEFARLLKAYRIHRVVGDRYAGEWPRERFRAHQVEYKLSEKSKSEIYQAALPGLNSGKFELLDDPRLIAQICSLERRTARGGRDSIDHPKGSHDDIANAALGALSFAGGTGQLVLKISEEALRMAERATPFGTREEIEWW